MKSMFRQHNPHRGFTLTELLVVITILVILGLIILVGINPMAQIFKGYDARRKADLAKIKIALENYYADHDCYPVFPLDPVTQKPTYTCGSDILSPYLAAMPCDPNDNKPYTIFFNPPGDTCPQKFAVYAQIYSFFDQDANKYLDCSKTYAVYSSDMSYGEINYGCSSRLTCQQIYGCIQNSCSPIPISAYISRTCPVAYCESDCNNQCVNQNNWCKL